MTYMWLNVSKMDNKNSLSLEESFLDSLSVVGGNIFIAAFEHDLANKFSDYNPAYEGKKLGDIKLEVTHNIHPDLKGRNGYPFFEQANFQIIDQEDFEILKDEDDIYTFIAAEALFYSDIILSDEYKIDQNRIWHRAIKTDYTLKHAGLKTAQKLDTLIGKCPVELTDDALAFCGLVDQYVRSDDFEIPYSIRKARAEQYSEELVRLSHRWTIPNKPGLLFNGYESEEFLQQYINYAERTIKEHSVNLNMLQKTGQKDSMTLNTIEEIASELSELNTSLASAQNALNNNKSSK
jgi:hypothetical protein